MTRTDSIVALLRLLVGNLPVELKTVEVSLGRLNGRRVRNREQGDSGREGG